MDVSDIFSYVKVIQRDLVSLPEYQFISLITCKTFVT